MSRFLSVVTIAFSLFSLANIKHVSASDNRLSDYNNLQKSDVLASKVIITSEEIHDQQASDLADLLRQYIGFEISRIGGTAQEAKIYIRGNDAEHTTVLIDGIKINSGNSGLAALHNIKTDIIDHIEITKGPNSSLYGTGAIGGVINIITHRSQQNSKSYTYSSGNYDSHMAMDFQTVENKTRFGLSLSNFQSQGLPNLKNSDVENAHFNNGAHFYLQTRLNDFDIETSAWLQKGNTQYQEFNTLIPRNKDFDNEFAAAKISRKVSSNWIQELSMSQVLDHHHVHHRAATAVNNDFETTYRDELDWRHNILLSQTHGIVTGINLTHERNSAIIDDRPYDSESSTPAIYLQDNFRFDNHQFMVSTRYTDHKIFGKNVSWNGDYGYWLNDSTRFSALIGSGYQAPTAIELFGVNGNLNLSHETTRQWELGIHHDYDRSQSVDLTVFGGETDDVIELDSTLSQFVNNSIHEARGAEASYAINRRQWGYRLAAIYQSPKDKTTGDFLEKRAQRSMTAAAHYQTSYSRYVIELLAVDKRPDTTGGTVFNSGYGLVNLSAQYEIGKTMTVIGEINNLTDKDYQLVDGYASTGQAFTVEITKTFD